MKKDEFLKAVNNYENYARTVNAHSKEAHNGAWGTMLELKNKKSYFFIFFVSWSDIDIIKVFLWTLI